jgi:dihydroxyacetone kinase-like predicted kinase
MNPSAKDILDAIEAVPTNDVLVLPNNSNVILTAEQAAGMSEKAVRVIPSKSVQAGFAAVGRFVPTESIAENERALLEELAGAATGEITVASRDVSLDGVDIRKGAYLGFADDVAVASGPDLDAVVHEVVDRMLAGGQSFLTVLTGENAPVLDGLIAALEARHPELEVDIHEGGQPHYPLLLVAQ